MKTLALSPYSIRSPRPTQRWLISCHHHFFRLWRNKEDLNGTWIWYKRQTINTHIPDRMHDGDESKSVSDEHKRLINWFASCQLVFSWGCDLEACKSTHAISNWHHRDDDIHMVYQTVYTPVQKYIQISSAVCLFTSRENTNVGQKRDERHKAKHCRSSWFFIRSFRFYRVLNIHECCSHKEAAIYIRFVLNGLKVIGEIWPKSWNLF